MSILRKIVSGGGGRATRFHTERNEWIGMGRLLAELPASIVQKTRTALARQRPEMPWWPYSAIAAVDRQMCRTGRTIEFGSGSSTLWLAKRSSVVTSIEHDPAWARITKQRLRKAGLNNVTLLIKEGDDYADLSYLEDGFDLAVVDGKSRWRCLENVLPMMNEGGLVYFDNADADKDKSEYKNPSEARLFEKIISVFLEKNYNSKLIKYVGLIHGELHAGEGWLLIVRRGGVRA